MYCLGFESTAHTFGVAIIDENNNVLANVKQMYTTEDGGLIPAKLAEYHTKHAKEITKQALTHANLTIEHIQLIAYSASPGIGHALRIGAAFARSLALHHNIPIIGVNHCIAHLEIGRIQANEQDPVLLYASGANTQIIALEANRYRIFGETLDIGIGNFIDTIARTFGLGFPGGPKIEQLANTYKGPLIPLPYSVKGMDVSFTGMQTKIKQLREKHTQKALAYALQEHAFAMLTEVTERALAHTQKESLVLGGGVACNKRLQEMCRVMCEKRGIRYFCPENQYLTDNAAMIAMLGITMYRQGKSNKPNETRIYPYLRTDEIEFTT